MAEEKEEDSKSPSEPVENVPDTHLLPVIGIGASAGGLEALNTLFEKMPEDTGAAFVVVQHLAPTKESSMPELLGRRTRLPVYQVTDEVRLEPNTIYLIPPDKNMSITEGTLHLLDLAKAPGIRHPIDFFFKSLARDRREAAVGIIMSGTGTDGTEGARSIKSELGLVIAQDPEDAKYDGMPRSAIDAGLADYVLAAADIPEELVKYLQGLPDMLAAGSKGPNVLEKSLPKIISLIRNATGNDFSSYKESTLLRRIRRRMALHQIGDAAQYVQMLQEDPKETTILFKELLINVTSFFRDAEAFAALKGALKEKLEHKSGAEEIRAWVVGCASGEEAYSIAMLLRELLEELGRHNKVQIFGTDLDSDAIDIARNGIYRLNISDDLTPERLKRFFTKMDDTYQVNHDIREMVVFASHNVVREPPFLKMDLITARNLLIYLKGDLQKKLMPIFHYALRESGILFLSPSETVGEFTDLFANIDRKWKIYQCKPSARAGGRVPPFPLQQMMPSKMGPQIAEITKADIANEADRILFGEYAPPYVVIDGADNIVHVRGDTGKYLKLPDGAVTVNILEMARQGLLSHLSLAIRSARRQMAEVCREHVQLDSPDASTVDIVARPLRGQSSELMVIFKANPHRDDPIAKGKPGKKRKSGATSEKDQYTFELEQELKRSREDLQASIEELETSNEELKSANEELLSSNEELQSTNEELETSREELRSVNEELSGVNAENLERLEQNTRARDDMRNLLNALEVAAVFLDANMNIKSFTPAATNFFSVRQSDIGRPLGDLSSFIEYGGSLTEDIRKVLTTAVRIEKDVQAKSGHWHLLRIMPYRGQENRVDGVLLTFFDIDQRRILEAALNYTQSIVDTVREPILVLDGDLRVISINRSFCFEFRVSQEETAGKHIYELGNGQWNIPELRNLLEEVIPKNRDFKDYPMESDFPLIGHRKMLLNGRRLYDELGSQRILLAIDDVTGQSSTEQLFHAQESEKENG